MPYTKPAKMTQMMASKAMLINARRMRWRIIPCSSRKRFSNHGVLIGGHPDDNPVRANDPIGAHLSWVEAVYNEAHRMSQLVSALLDMSYLDEGDGALNLEPVSLLALGETVDTIYRPVLEESGLTLNVVIPPDAVVLGDALRLRQLLLIFLDNAHKHTKNGTVTLKVVLRGSHAEIHLEDTGQGMPTALVPKATGRFVHGGNSPIGGVSTGLGLAIAKKIVEAHHGRLTIRSVPGVGTDVVVSLRLL